MRNGALLPLVPVTASNLNDDDGQNDQQYHLAGRRSRATTPVTPLPSRPAQQPWPPPRPSKRPRSHVYCARRRHQPTQQTDRPLNHTLSSVNPSTPSGHAVILHQLTQIHAASRTKVGSTLLSRSTRALPGEYGRSDAAPPTEAVLGSLITTTPTKRGDDSGANHKERDDADHRNLAHL